MGRKNRARRKPNGKRYKRIHHIPYLEGEACQRWLDRRQHKANSYEEEQIVFRGEVWYADLGAHPDTSIEIDGSTTGLDKALKTVNTTIRSTQTQLKDVQKLLKLDPSNTELLSQKQRLLKEAIGATKDKLESLKTAQEQAKKQLEEGKLGQDKYDALQREIEETEQALKQLESQVSTTYAALEKIDQTGQKFKEVGDKMAGVGRTMTTHVTAPIVGLGAAAVKTTADFDAQMSKVQAISGATGDEFDELRAKAREMGSKTKFSASEAGEAFEYMAMAGWKTGDMLDGIEGIMNLAAASGEDLGTTSDIVTDYITGVMCAANDHKLSSEVGFKGICRKVLIFLLVGIGHVLDTQIIGTGSVLRTAVIFFYLSNEGVSLLENAGHLGLPIPEKLKVVLEQLHDRAEKENTE